MTRQSGERWSAPQTMPGDSPDVAIDSSGEALLVWSTGAPHKHVSETVAAMAPRGGRFGKPVVLGTDSGANGAPYTFVGYDASGNATALWAQEDNHLHYAVRPRGKRWGGSHEIPNPGRTVQWPSYAVSKEGDVIAAWNDYGTIYAAILPASGGPPIVRRLYDGPYGGPPRVAVDARGDALVVWAKQGTGYRGPAKMMVSALRAPSTSFGRPKVLASVYYTNTYEASVVMDNRGDAMLAWVGAAFGPKDLNGVTFVRRSATGQFSKPRHVAGPDGAYPPALAFDRSGVCYAFWAAGREHNLVFAEAAAAGRMFSGKPVLIHRYPHPTDTSWKTVWPQPALVAGRNGFATGVWAYGSLAGTWIKETSHTG